MAVGNKRAVLTPDVMSHYREAQPTPEARSANAALPGYIIGATEWLSSIWEDRGIVRRQTHAGLLGGEGHSVPEEGTRPLEVRTVRQGGTRVRRLRALPG